MTDEVFPFELDDNTRTAAPEPAQKTPQHSAPLPTGRGTAVTVAPGANLVEVEKSRAEQEIQAALTVAQRFGRDEVRAETKALIAAERFGLAEKALYLYPRGAEKITGPTIRLAEELARTWTNLRYGFQELEKVHGRSLVRAFCWDLVTNTQAERTFTVDHKIQLKGGKEKYLTDPRDIYEIVANQAQRRVRACILELLPSDLVAKVVAKCRETVARGPKNIPIQQRVALMVQAFQKEFGVPQDAIEKYLGHGFEAINQEELADLAGIYNALKDGQPRESYFELKTVREEEGGAAKELKDLLGKKSGE